MVYNVGIVNRFLINTDGCLRRCYRLKYFIQSCNPNLKNYGDTSTILNSGSIIEHDSSVGNNSHISTMATVNADCIIGDNCFLSSHSVINRGIQLNNGITVFSGSVVTKSIDGNSIAVGNPARIIKKNVSIGFQGKIQKK